jgi:Putative zinc-finger
MIGWFFPRSRASLIPITSDSRIRWSRFDWSAKQSRGLIREEARRKDTQRGHSEIADQHKARCDSNPRKESALNKKRKFRRATRVDLTCKDEVGLIADYLADRLDPAVLAPFEKHLGQCPDCAAFLNTYKRTIEVTKSFLKAQSIKLWTQPLRRPHKGPKLVATLIFSLHLFISNAYLTT